MRSELVVHEIHTSRSRELMMINVAPLMLVKYSIAMHHVLINHLLWALNRTLQLEDDLELEVNKKSRVSDCYLLSIHHKVRYLLG